MDFRISFYRVLCCYEAPQTGVMCKLGSSTQLLSNHLPPMMLISFPEKTMALSFERVKTAGVIWGSNQLTLESGEDPGLSRWAHWKWGRGGQKSQTQTSFHHEKGDPPLAGFAEGKEMDPVIWKLSFRLLVSKVVTQDICVVFRPPRLVMCRGYNTKFCKNHL